MSRIFNRYKKIFGMIMLVISVLFFIFWEFEGRKQLMYEDIIVLNCDAHKGMIIDQKMITKMKVSIENISSKTVMSSERIVGLEAKQFIPAGFPISEDFFGDPRLVLNEDEKIMKLPTQWIYSVPETIRRGDDIYIYSVKQNNELDSNFEKSKDKQFLLNTTVAYVKDDSNREVESIGEDRLVGTSSVKNIEIIINEDEFLKLKEFIKSGYVLVIMYN